MTNYQYFILAVWFLLLPVLGEFLSPTATSIISLETGGPFAPCDGFGLCERPNGGVFFGETMEKHLYPHAIWIESAGVFYNFADRTNSTNFTDPLRLQIGDIVALKEEFVPILYSAALETAINPWIGALCKRRILGPGRDFGYLIVEPPVSDPDTLFESIAQDPLLAGLPSGLRSQLDPALVIPSPTIGCERKKCFQFIAVSSLPSLRGPVFYSPFADSAPSRQMYSISALIQQTRLVSQLLQARHRCLHRLPSPCMSSH